MTTFALVHGSGDGGWAWQRVRTALEERGHRAVAPDLPTDREDGTWADCAQTVVDAAGDTADLVVVGHSAGGFVVPLVADRADVRLQVYVAGMVPRPGETATGWFEAVGWDGEVTEEAFYEDVPAELAAQARAHQRQTSERLAGTPWPLPALPDVPARYVVTTRDRFLPPDLQRRVAAERLGIAEPDPFDAGHCPSLSRPDDLADLLVGLSRPRRATAPPPAGRAGRRPR